MHVGLVTTFYPNRAEPLRAVFVRNLAAALESHAKVSVVSPVPYAPPYPHRPRWAALREVPRETQDDTRAVFHPRFAVVPKLTLLNAATYAAAITPLLRKLARGAVTHRAQGDARHGGAGVAHQGGIDVLHAHCAFPDGVAVAIAASMVNLPFVLTAHGSDINVYADDPAIRPQLSWALKRASAVIAVSRAMCDKIQGLAPEIVDRLHHIPCAGIDRRVFLPRDRDAARRRVGIPESGRVIVFVGQLVPIKAVSVLLAAWNALLDSGHATGADRLVIIGEGPLRRELENTASQIAFKKTVLFPGEIPQASVADWISASTALCLPSRNEGTPNVIVETLASGRPAVASRVGGIPDLITEGRNGFLAPPENPAALAAALGSALVHSWNATEIAAGVADYTWNALADRNHAVLGQAIARNAGAQCLQ